MMSIVLRLSNALILCLLLAACGFQPMYGARDGSSAKRELASVAVAEQKTRLGQLIRNEVLSSIAPVGQEAPQRYVLEILPEPEDEVVIQAFDTDVLRRAYRVEAAFRLMEIGADSEVYSGRTFAQASYDRTGTPFSNLQARTSAQERAAKEVGADIATRLAAFFASRR